MERRSFCLSLTNRLRATAILPALFVSVVMGITIYSVLDYANRDALKNSAQKTIETMTVLYQAPLISGDSAIGKTLMRSLLSDQEIVSAKVFDVNGNLFVEGSNDSMKHSYTLRVTRIVKRDTLPLNIWDGSEKSPKDTSLGQIELVVAPAAAIDRMNAVLFIFYSVTLLALLFSIWLGTRIGKSILNPLKTISAAVSQMRAGNYTVSHKVTSSDELGTLSENTIHLATELSSKDAAIDRQMSELLHSREDAFRLQDENARLLQDLGNEYIDPLISAIGSLQRVSSPSNSKSGDHLQTAIKNIEYVLETTEEFKSLVDHDIATEYLQAVPVQLPAVCQTLLDSYASACAEKDISLSFENDIDQDVTDRTIYSDPIRIRVLLKNVLEYAISNAEVHGRIAVRTILSSHAGRAVIVIDLFDDNQHLSEDALSLLNTYFSSSQDFLEQEKYQSIPIEYRTANRVASSLDGTISIKRYINGGYIFSIQFLSHAKPGANSPSNIPNDVPARSDVFYFRQYHSENSILERYLSSKGIQMRNVDTLASFATELNDPDCRLIFIELDTGAPEYDEGLRRIRDVISSSNASVVALVESGHKRGSINLVENGFTDVMVRPVSASHIYSIIKANSSVSTSLERIFTPQ